MIVPTRLTAHFTTTLDPVTGAPQVVICFGAAEQDAAGNYQGKGTFNLLIEPATEYNEIDPATQLPTGATIRGRRIVRALYGLFLKSQE